MQYGKISAKAGTVGVTTFSGINRRIRASAGEFSDMENLWHKEYPCLQSAPLAKDMGISMPNGAVPLKMMIPKRLDDEVTGFSGIMSGGIYVNGNRINTGFSISEFSDAVDYNGAFITVPELKGANYLTQKSVCPVNLIHKMYFFNDYADETAASITPKLYLTGANIPFSYFNVDFRKLFKVGDEIILSGLTDEFECNNTIFPKSSMDYSNTTSPVSIRINGMSITGSNINSECVLTMKITNAKGENIGWPKGTGRTGDPNGFTETVIGTITKKTPKGHHACVAHNRLWVCSHTGEEINASALGKPLEFYEFNGTDADSWSGTVGTPGTFTGIAPWQNRVVVFKPDIIHVIYGDLPSAFGIEKTYAAGCIDSKSIASVGGRLMWLYYDGFYAYSGGRPQRVSDKLHTQYISCNAFSDGVRYYGRCTKIDGTTELVIYDSELNLWSKITDIDIISADYYKGKIYVCDKTAIYCLFGGEYGDFYAETPELTFDTFDDKSLIYASVRCKIESGFLNIYTSVNGGEWIPHKGISKSGKHKLPIRYAPGDTIRLRLEGSGNVCITELNMEVLIKER